MLAVLRKSLEKQAAINQINVPVDSDFAKGYGFNQGGGAYYTPSQGRDFIIGSPYEKRFNKLYPKWRDEGFIINATRDIEPTPNDLKWNRLIRRHELTHMLRDRAGHLEKFTTPTSPRSGVWHGFKEEWIANKKATNLPYEKLPKGYDTPLSKLKENVKTTVRSVKYKYPKPFQTLITGQANPDMLGNIRTFAKGLFG